MAKSVRKSRSGTETKEARGSNTKNGRSDLIERAGFNDDEEQ